jgi:hypothetical protein
MKTGDHLVTPRIGYTHHGLYVGDGRVIHYAGFADGLSKERIEITSLARFSDGHGISIRKHSSRLYKRKKSVERALNRLGENAYNLLFNNCEHFVNWCIEGEHNSPQVNQAAAVATATYAVHKSLPKSRSEADVMAHLLSGGLVSKEVSREVGRRAVQSIAPTATKYVAATAAGASLLTTTTGVSAGTYALTSVVAAPVLPYVATIAVGVMLWDWLSD